MAVDKPTDDVLRALDVLRDCLAEADGDVEAALIAAEVILTAEAAAPLKETPTVTAAPEPVIEVPPPSPPITVVEVEPLLTPPIEPPVEPEPPPKKRRSRDKWFPFKAFIPSRNGDAGKAP